LCQQVGCCVCVCYVCSMRAVSSLLIGIVHLHSAQRDADVRDAEASLQLRNILLALRPGWGRIAASARPQRPHTSIHLSLGAHRPMVASTHLEHLQTTHRYSQPTMIFEKFTEDGVTAITYSMEEAKRLDYMATNEGCFLVGIMLQERGRGGKVLSELGLTSQGLQKSLEDTMGRGNSTTGSGLTPTAKLILDRAVSEARRLGSPLIDTGHLLLALISDSTFASYKMLENLGIDIEQVRKMVEEKIKEDNFVGPSTFAKATAKQQSSGGVLEKFSTDLTKKAAEGTLDPVVGREEEVEATIEILACRKKNNPVFIGEAGVGKTAIATGIAQRIHEGTVPRFLRNKRLLELDLAGMVSGTKYRGDFEERLHNVIDEASAAKGEIILMIDEIHTLVGAGASEGSMAAGNIMKPKLASGELQVIGATTKQEYTKYIEKDKALERRFAPVDVPEPSIAQALEILKGIQHKYEDYHGLKYTPEAIEACVTLADKYVADRYLPDKAIDMLDRTGSRVKVNSNTHSEIEKPVVSVTDVRRLVSDVTGIPVNKVSSNESVSLLGLEDVLHKRVIGQHEAITAVSKAVRRARTGLKDPARPIASFIFAGPTGVGKTELCKALSSTYYGNDAAMLRFDMSEFMEKHSVSKLIGSPPGYVGYDDESLLCDRIRRNPYSLVLFDEIEKAHPDVFNIMLQILEDGRLTDSKGRVVSFKNSMIIMTSNVGAQEIEKTIDGGGGFGFDAVTTNDREDTTYERLKEVLSGELKNRFKPEFINRLDDTIVFKPLTRENVKEIAELEFSKVLKRFREKYSGELVFTEQFKDKVLEEGFDPKFGARPLRRAVSKLLEDELASAVLSEPLSPGEVVTMDVGEDSNVLLRRQQTTASA